MTFTATTDGAAPILMATSPIDGATNVSVSTNLVLTFSETVARGTGNVVLKNGTDGTTVEQMDVSDLGSVSIAGEQVTVDPALDLKSKQPYYVRVDPGAFTDPTGNAYGGIADTTSWDFETADIQAPTVTLSHPNGGEHIAGGSSYAIRWNATDAGGLKTTPIAIAYSIDGGSTWTTIATALSNSGSYSWTVPSVDSTQGTTNSGNAMMVSTRRPTAASIQPPQ